MAKGGRGRSKPVRLLPLSQIGVLIVANSPSQKWENGKMVKRNIETNRWTVPADNAEADEADEPTTKAIESSDAENKSIKRAAKK